MLDFALAGVTVAGSCGDLGSCAAVGKEVFMYGAFSFPALSVGGLEAISAFGMIGSVATLRRKFPRTGEVGSSETLLAWIVEPDGGAPSPVTIGKEVISPSISSSSPIPALGLLSDSSGLAMGVVEGLASVILWNLGPVIGGDLFDGTVLLRPSPPLTLPVEVRPDGDAGIAGLDTPGLPLSRECREDMDPFRRNPGVRRTLSAPALAVDADRPRAVFGVLIEGGPLLTSSLVF